MLQGIFRIILKINCVNIKTNVARNDVMNVVRNVARSNINNIV